MKLKLRKTTAAVLFNINKPLKILSIDLPENLKKNQVLIKNLYSGICGTQIAEYKGLKNNQKYLPHLMGHESVGVVIQKHSSVSKLNIGDKVITHWMNSKGNNSEAPKYYYKKKLINSGLITTFSNYSVISKNKVTKINHKIRNYGAPLFGCSLSTAYGTFLKLRKIKKNKTIAVSGCGPIGLNIIQIAKVSKPKKIIAIDINNKKLNFAKKFAKIDAVNLNKKNSINELIKKEEVDYFFECSGNINMIENSFRCLNSQGILIIIGNSKLSSNIRINPFDFIKGKKIIGSYGGNFNPDRDIDRFYKVIKKNNINIYKQITKIIKLKEINKAFKDLSKNLSIGKTIIKF